MIKKKKKSSYGMLGKNHSEKTKRLISETHLKNKRNEGKHHSIKTEFKKGQKPWNTGLKGEEYFSHLKEGKVWNKGKKGYHVHTEKHKEELRKSMTGNKFREGLVPWNKNKQGYKLWKNGRSDEVKERIRKKLIGHPCYKSKTRGKNISNALKKWYIKNPQAIEKFRKRREKMIIPIKDSSIEIKIQKFLTKLHIEYFTHKYLSDITHSYQCDIFILKQRGFKQKTIIECDGCYFHGCKICNLKTMEWIEKQKIKDKLRTKELIEKGYRVIRIWEHEIKVMELNDFKIKIGKI